MKQPAKWQSAHCGFIMRLVGWERMAHSYMLDYTLCRLAP